MLARVCRVILKMNIATLLSVSNEYFVSLGGLHVVCKSLHEKSFENVSKFLQKHADKIQHFGRLTSSLVSNYVFMHRDFVGRKRCSVRSRLPFKTKSKMKVKMNERLC